MTKIFNSFIQPQEIHQCRICLVSQGKTIVPCKCDGSIKYVHKKCMADWMTKNLKNQIKKKQKFVCQICKTNVLYETNYFFQQFQTWERIKNKILKLYLEQGKWLIFWSVCSILFILDIFFSLIWFILLSVQESKYYNLSKIPWFWVNLFVLIIGLIELGWLVYIIVKFVIKQTLKISEIKEIQQKQNTEANILPKRQNQYKEKSMRRSKNKLCKKVDNKANDSFGQLEQQVIY